MDDQLDKELDFSQAAQPTQSTQPALSPFITTEQGSSSPFGGNKRLKIMIGFVIFLAIVLIGVIFYYWF